MTLEIEHQNNSILLVHYSPDYSGSIFCFSLLLVFTVFCLFKGTILSLVGLIIVIFFIVLIVITFRERELWCVVNKKTGAIAYTKGGILGSQYGTQSVQYHVTEIIALEMARYANRGQDTFQIRLTLVGNFTLPLSSTHLDFRLCQSVVNEIHQFIGVDTPLRAIDKSFFI